METHAPLRLRELATIFFRIGSLAFGGGGATLAMMHGEFCVRRPVIPDEEFQLLFGISRIVPGMNLLSLTALLGYRTHGLLGSLVALTALTVPSFTLIILGCLLFRGGHPNPYLQGAVRGLGPAAAALLILTGWQLSTASLSKQSPPARALWLVVIAATTLLALTGAVHPAWIILAGAAVGVGLAGKLRATP